AVVAKRGIAVPFSDLFGVKGTKLLDRLELPEMLAARLASQRRLIQTLEVEISQFDRLISDRLRQDPSYAALRTIPGIGPVLAAVLIAEIGDITRFTRAEQLTSWAGLTPRHHESDTKVHRGRITKQGSPLVRWAAVESVQLLPATSRVGRYRDQVADRRGRNIGVIAAARKQLEFVFYALRDGHVRALAPAA
ncbi:transposase, partial [Georgenia subflava]|uniref:transposase n=1 Tax=Georgenia subflava TaxID=1622177 RepID=UPI00126447AC